MPVPIMPVNINPLMRGMDNNIQPADYGSIDVSALPFTMEKKGRFEDLVKISNFEAGILMKLWSESGAGPNDDEVPIPSTITNNDILRLKASGLISGDTEKFRFTSRGKDVLTTMVLGEKNSFDKSSESVTFENILSERKKLASGGPRFSVGKAKK